MKILVTGGAGFIGSNLVDRFINEGYDVAIVDDLSTGNPGNLNPKARFYKMDIRNPELELVFEKEKPDYVSHHAAQASVTRSMREPMLDCRVNIEGSINVINLSQKFGVKKIIYASTGGTVYGEPVYLPVDEDHPINPLSPYGASKHTVEHYLYMYMVDYGLDYTVLRYPNVYGPRQDPYGEAGVVAIFIHNMLNGERPVIFGDGTATRDYVYVDDIVEANIMILFEGGGEIYNLGSNLETSVNQIFSLLSQELGFHQKPIYKTERKGEIRRIYLTNDKAKADLGWEPKIPLTEGISKTVDYSKHKFFVRRQF
jgi:UDP-glucose 4-epimerase